jgi:DNA-3-methyladenine glycosylase I
MGDEKNRCPWSGDDPLYVRYHDTEWGVPNHDDRVHFEFLVLESAQAGLSWNTILKRRENYRKAYDGFDPAKVALYDEQKIEKLLADTGIIRNRKKIEASVNNAKLFLEVQKEFGSFDTYLWNFVNGKQVVGHWKSISEIPAKTDLSETVSKDLKKRGFKFLGPIIIYSHLQAVGIVNDHIETCYRFREVLC